jgi:hypothetical protein
VIRRCNLGSYVTTADAIAKYFSDDPEWCRLSDEFHSIARDPGALGLYPGKERQLEDEARAELAKRELAKREDYLFDNVYQAVVRQALQVLLMDGSRTFQLPGLYTLDTHRMADALRSGWAAKLRLTGPDTIWTAARRTGRTKGAVVSSARAVVGGLPYERPNRNSCRNLLV